MNGFDISTISGIYVGSTPYSAIYKGSTLVWSAGPHDYSRDYFTIESLANNNTISVKNYFGSTMAGPENGLTLTLYWSTDKVNWTSVTVSRSSSQAGPSIISSTITTLNNGEKIYIKGNAPTGGQAHPNGSTSNANYYNYFSSTANINVQGNIMSLLYGDNFENQTTLVDARCLQYLFYTNTYLIDTSNLILPATTLSDYCYSSMFYNCTSLTTAPELPATTLANYCYYYMFYGCTSLTTAPELPVTTLANSCYQSMFQGCTSLVSAPELPAITLASYCYRYMFRGCTSLTTAPELPATTLANYCYQYMFYGCTSLTTAPELPATTLADYCYGYMFQGCTSLTTAPELKATTLVSNCYRYMFNGCTNLTYVKALFTTDITSSSSTYTMYWLQNVAASGTFIKSDSATWSVTGDNGVPSGWTVKIDGAPADNASMKLYYNSCVGSMKEFTSVSTGNNLSPGSDTSKWYYGNNKYVSFNRSNSRYSTATVKLSLVITGFTQFKCALSGNTYTSNTARIGLGVLNYNESISSGDIYESNSNITIAIGNSTQKDYIYTGLDPDTKYLISIYLFANGNCNPKLLVPSSYPSFTLTDSSFSSSSDYTDIFG